MKWLRVLCRSIVFVIATSPSAFYSRTVQPVTYSYTTSNDGEYTKTYQNGVHRIYNQQTTPYLRHPSILTYHYYDSPAEGRKIERVVVTTPAANHTHKGPRKKNDYVAKVSYVRDPESVSFATTIEDKGEEKPSMESPIRKLVIRKRRPLKPADEIPVQESNDEENQFDNSRKNYSQNITAKVTRVEEASPAEVYNKIKQIKTAAGLPSNVNMHKTRKIRLKPTTTSTTSTTPKPISTSTDALMWKDVLHEPMNTTQEQAKTKKKTKPSTAIEITSTTISPPKLSQWKQTTTVPQSNSTNRWKFSRTRNTGTSQQPPITKMFMKSGKYTPNYEDNLIGRTAEATQLTTDVLHPPQELNSQNSAEGTDDEQESNEEPEGMYEDLDYLDEYNDHGEEESGHSNDNDETGENAEHTHESPTKLLRKPLRYSYSSDQKEIATDNNHHTDGENGSRMKKVSGEKYHKNSYQREGDKGDIGHSARKIYDHSNKGILDKKNHKKQYNEEDNHKKIDHEERGHLSDGEMEAAGKKAAEYKESGKHQKGHSTKGSHNVHKKNEYMKKYEFFDEHHEGDAHEKYNDYDEGHKFKHGGAIKHAHKDKDYKEGHKAKKGKHGGGHYLHEGFHHVDDHGSNKHYGDTKKYNNRDGSYENKKWKYEKAKNSEDENENESE